MSLSYDIDVVALIPRLRKMARKYRPNSTETADDLLAQALTDAIADIKSRPAGDDELFDWLQSLMLKHLN